MPTSNLPNLSLAISGQVVDWKHPFFNCSLCIFHHTEEAISFTAQVAVVFCLLVQLEGRGYRELEGCSNTSGQNKSFLQRHHVIHLTVNDTSSSYSSLNDLVCVALLVARETARGSLEMSLVIVWRCREAERERERKKGLWSHLRPAALIQGGTVAPCIWSARYSLDLTLDHGATILHWVFWRDKKKATATQWTGTLLLHVRAEAVIPP